MYIWYTSILNPNGDVIQPAIAFSKCLMLFSIHKRFFDKVPMHPCLNMGNPSTKKIPGNTNIDTQNSPVWKEIYEFSKASSARYLAIIFQEGFYPQNYNINQSRDIRLAVLHGMLWASKWRPNLKGGPGCLGFLVILRIFVDFLIIWK